MMTTKKAIKIAVIDLETDPFLVGRTPNPFAAGIRTETDYADFWGENCVNDLVGYISGLKDPHIIYAHNGGKFDFMFMLEHLQNPIKIINGRIAKARLGIHELRDSWLAIPMPLAAYKKDEIDYGLFEADKRDGHKADILHYLAKDCDYLYDLISAFVARFGPKLTIGGVALGEVRKMHPFVNVSAGIDSAIRPYYFGGRVQAFETGIINGDFVVVDVNSMYPDVMRNCIHPCGRKYASPAHPKITPSGHIKGFGARPYFARVIGKNYGAFPTRLKTGLSFDVSDGEFFVTSHELIEALDLGIFDLHRVAEVLVPHQTIKFDDYVDKFFAEKVSAEISGDAIGRLFAKLLLNNAYGKAAQNPENYYDYRIVRDRREIKRDEWDLWDLYESLPQFGIEIWRAKSQSSVYYDVAIGASITGASRAKLLRGIHDCTRPIYCDTDSLICERFHGHTDATVLGAWKIEAKLDRAAVAGKKLYAGFSGGECVKLASKGVRLTPDQIVALCNGATVEWSNPAPSFDLSGTANFISRKIKKIV